PSPQPIATRGGGAATGVESVAPPVTHVAADPPTVAATAERTPGRPAERAAQPADAIDRLSVAPISVERMQLATIQPPDAIAPASLDLVPLVVTPLAADEGSSGRP